MLDVRGRLDRAAAGCAAGRLGVPVRQSALSRRRRHRGGGDGDGPRADARSAIDYRAAIARAQEWISGLQSKNGAWGAFDADNEYYYLNNIPFADHGALLDPPTEDVTARCLSMLAQLGDTPENSPAVARGVDYLKRTQLADGSWYGRWGMNYIYGTWSVLCALNAAGVDHAAPEMRKAADWLVAIQNEDGGWGEDGASYKLDYQRLRAGAEHGVADRLGAARPDGGRRGRRSGGRARHRLSAAHTRAAMASGRRRATPRRVSRGCSICATTATRSSSRCGRWRAIAT